MPEVFASPVRLSPVPVPAQDLCLQGHQDRLGQLHSHPADERGVVLQEELVDRLGHRGNDAELAGLLGQTHQGGRLDVPGRHHCCGICARQVSRLAVPRLPEAVGAGAGLATEPSVAGFGSRENTRFGGTTILSSARARIGSVLSSLQVVGPFVDITPYVGIAGAVVGGGIGLFGHRMNLKEQRRKDLRERVADFLREVDLLALNTDRFRLAANASDRSRVTALIPELREISGQAHHCAQYMDLTAPWLLQQYVRDVWYGVDGLHTAALDFWLAGAAADQLEANYTTAKTELATRREALVRHLRPSINGMPWWTRRPFRGVVARWRKFRGLPTMNLP